MLREQLEGSAMFVDRLAECRKSFEKTCSPFDVATAGGEVVEFNAEKAVHFAHVARWPIRPELRRSSHRGLDVCSALGKEFDKIAVAAQCNVAERRLRQSRAGYG